MSAPTTPAEPRCKCGHLRYEHVAGGSQRGNCVHSGACGCRYYRPSGDA